MRPFMSAAECDTVYPSSRSPLPLAVPFRPAGAILAYYMIHGRCLDLRDKI